ncbi:DUF4157 domain-containing protein [Mucilaginibacter celer]|uniref:DUF4157 domain-containing protein n=1 Tax=Mucilaginibacter celer TaxID=2305508 RepID=A0A494VTV6_9SPHI|nr:DUF4157 domain-containing protein [Mucilaginibacter celer]AYL99047.1 DUF4157 domain-containing protein [Mucilaginibacter celer]
MGMIKNAPKHNASQSNAIVANVGKSSSAIPLRDNRPGVADRMQQMGLKSDNTPVQKKSNNTGLPDHLKTGVENLSGHSMDDVKVHYNSPRPAQLQAHAYAQGTDIHIASGQEKHLPHEAWHVVQQKQGRVKPTTQLKGNINVNDNKALENEADTMGAKALQTKVKGSLPKFHRTNAGGYPVQLVQTRKGKTVLTGKAAKKAPPASSPKLMDAMSRLRRAHQRAEKRRMVSPDAPLGKKRIVATAFGPVGVSKGRGGQPNVTSRQEDFNGAVLKSGRYKDLEISAAEAGMLSGKAGKLSDSRKRKLAMLVGITGHAERSRFSASGKISRQAFRNVRDGKRNYKQSFVGDNPDFAMAAKGGAQAYHRALKGEQELTKPQQKLIEEMSDSSDEDE